MPDLSEYLAICSPKSRKFVAAARTLGADLSVISLDPPVIEMRSAGRRHILYQSHLPFNTKNAVLLAGNKSAAKAAFRAAGLRTPAGIVAENSEEALRLVRQSGLQFPLAAKPLDGTAGLGVFLDLADEAALEAAALKIVALMKTAKILKSRTFIVEEMASGKDYRVLVLDGEVIACAERQPASVTGDGKLSIEALVIKANEVRPSNFQIRVNEESLALLEKQGFGPESVPAAGEPARLQQSANVSLGGVPVDRTDSISPYFQEVAVAASRALGLRYAGIDIMTEDIGAPDPKSPYFILEANGNLIDFDIHEPPLAVGPKRDIASLLITRLFA